MEKFVVLKECYCGICGREIRDREYIGFYTTKAGFLKMVGSCCVGLK